MKRIIIAVLCVIVMVTFAYAGVKSYQVTGPVLEVTSDKITVQKGNDKWEIARDGGTKVTGDLKVGSKVMIQYEMKATSIEAKEEKAKAKSKSK